MPRFDGSMASYNSINSVFTQTLDDYLTKKTVPTINGAGGSSAVLTGTPVLSDAQQREVAGQFTWLALKVGLVQDSVKTSDSKFKCSKNLTDAFLQPTLSPYFRNDSNARLFDVRRLLNPSVNIEDLKSK